MIAVGKSTTRFGNLPPLQHGDRLTAKEFCRRWDVTPHLKHAELIGGQVYMNPPISAGSHGVPHGQVIIWLGQYALPTLGVEVISESSIHFGPDNLPQPDALLRIKDQFGGTSRMIRQELHGPPELIVEVAASSAAYDLFEKKQMYALQGVQEYLVWVIHERKFVWFVLGGKAYVEQECSRAGVIKSQVFPGLWLDTKGMLADNWPQVLTTLKQGMESPAYLEFAAKLKCQNRKKRKS